MKRYLALFSLMLAGGCVQPVEMYSKTNLTQVDLDRDYAYCQIIALQAPQQHTDSASYSATTMQSGDFTQTFVRKNDDPWAAMGDAIANEGRRDTVRRVCMRSKGYTFLGLKYPTQR